MNTTSRRLIAGIALVLTTALTATACIGYDAKEAPVASGGTTLYFHPRFSNTTGSLDARLAGDVNAAYRQSSDKGRLDYVVVATDVYFLQGRTNLPLRSTLIAGHSAAGTREHLGVGWQGRAHQALIVAHSNGSFTLPYRWDAQLCGNSTIKVIARWSNSWVRSYERLEIPVKQGRSCPGLRSGQDQATWEAMERAVRG